MTLHPILNTLIVVVLISAALGCIAEETDFSVMSDVMLRYESESGHHNIPQRERLRLIAHLGAQYQINQHWTISGRLRTGLKNKQNVPAITIHKFNDQPSPDSDIFVDRLFVEGKLNKLKITAGKIPWSSWQVTDLYWDRQLNPIGVHLDYQINHQQHLAHMSALPLDGHTGTVGQLHVSQWRYQFNYHDWTLNIAPWLMLYKSQDHAEFAKRDTQFDNQLLNLSIRAKKGKWALGLDLGRSLAAFTTPDIAHFSDQKNARAIELKYGNLKQKGNFQGHLRYIHFERFAAITEFASNATQRFGTTNVAGWDLRIRRKMAASWWLGARFSHMSRLVGKPESGNRFRVEVKYHF